MDRCALAYQYHKEGWNCAQSVAAACAGLAGRTPEEVLPLLTVRIVKLMTFGAFAEVVPGVDGLIHISQIADRRIDKPEDVLSENQTVDVKITAIDEEKQKISLSIRALLAPAGEPEEDAGVLETEE